MIKQSAAKIGKERVKQAKESTWYFLTPEPETSQKHGRCEGMEMKVHADTNEMNWLNQTWTHPIAREGINA